MNNKNEIIREYYNKIANKYDDFYVDNISLAENTIIKNCLKGVINKNDRIVDLFCGTGLTMDLIKHDPLLYTGVDLSPRMIAIAKKKHPTAKFLNINILDIKEFAVAETVTALFSTNLVINVDDLFRKINQLLVPGGKAFVMLPSRFSLKNIHDMQKSGKNSFKKLDEYNIRNCKENISCYPTSQFYSSREIKKVLENYFTEIELSGFNYFVEIEKDKLIDKKAANISKMLEREMKLFKNYPDQGFYILIKVVK